MSTRKLCFDGSPQNLPDDAQMFANFPRQRIQFFVSHCRFLFVTRRFWESIPLPAVCIADIQLQNALP